jgi:hypothetical protein
MDVASVVDEDVNAPVDDVSGFCGLLETFQGCGDIEGHDIGASLL